MEKPQDKLLRTIVASPITKAAIAILIAVLALIGIGVVGINQVNNNQAAIVPVYPTGSSITGQFLGTSQALKLEVAADEASRAKGLMFRTELESNSGMLFIFDKSQELSFWMKDTLIPLDIIFLDANRKVINIHQNTKTNQTIETYESNGLAKFALEVNAGWAKINKIVAGDQLELR